jgi:tetratricopeptide (TPR) repeat protein
MADTMAAAPARVESGFWLAGTRELLLPGTVMVCFGLKLLADVPWWVLAAVAVPMLVLYALAPSWAARSVASFDRDLVQLLSTGRRTALPSRYARSFGMRLFAPPAVRAERHALVSAENGRPAAAREGYRLALREQGKHAPLRVLLGYAHACYALGDDAEAIRVYRELIEHAGALPGVRRNLAHALVRHGDSLREALAMIERDAAQDLGPGRAAERDLLRAVAHAKLGERERARELLEQSGTAEGELASALRLELERALEGAAEARPA